MTSPAAILPDRAAVRAVVCDVYGTLLDVVPGAADPGQAWHSLWHGIPGIPPPCSWTDFNDRCRAEVPGIHALLRVETGTDFPEVQWPSVMLAAAPELQSLSRARLAEFAVAWAAIRHGVGAMPGAAAAVAAMRRTGLLVTIASNAQAYTIRELDSSGINPPGIPWEPEPFWSFIEGTAKPSPRVFSVLTRRCAARGITPDQILMIGDRMDNDVNPALAAGWHAWHFDPDAGRNWSAAEAWAERRIRA